MKSRFLFLLVLLGCAHLHAQDTNSVRLPQIAVVSVSGDEDLTAQQLSFLTGQLSAELVKTKAFTVLDRGQMEFILQEQGFQQSGTCNTSECQVQMGQLLGVEYIVASSLVRFGSKYALRADYIDVGTGKVTLSVDQDEAGELEDVYKALCQGIGKKLAKAVRSKKKRETTESAAIDSSAMIPAPALLAQEQLSESAISAEVTQPSAPLSSKRKIALALWGAAGLGAGAGWYLDGQGLVAAEDYDVAVMSLNKSDADNAYSRIGSAETGRNACYGFSAGALVLGAALWFWPEDE